MNAVLRFLRRLWYFGSRADSAVSAERDRRSDEDYLRSAGWGWPDAQP